MCPVLRGVSREEEGRRVPVSSAAPAVTHPGVGPLARRRRSVQGLRRGSRSSFESTGSGCYVTAHESGVAPPVAREERKVDPAISFVARSRLRAEGRERRRGDGIPRPCYRPLPSGVSFDAGTETPPPPRAWSAASTRRERKLWPDLHTRMDPHSLLHVVQRRCGFSPPEVVQPVGVRDEGPELGGRPLVQQLPAVREDCWGGGKESECGPRNARRTAGYRHLVLGDKPRWAEGVRERRGSEVPSTALEAPGGVSRTRRTARKGSRGCCTDGY